MSKRLESGKNVSFYSDSLKFGLDFVGKFSEIGYVISIFYYSRKIFCE
jgi:hypothetical protein